MSKQQAEDWTIGTDHDDDQPEEDRFEEQAMHAITSAARDLAGRGWTPHDLGNLVAEALAVEQPAPLVSALVGDDEPIPL